MRAPADYRIQKMRAAEESSRQMNAYVKVRTTAMSRVHSESRSAPRTHPFPLENADNRVPSPITPRRARTHKACNVRDLNAQWENNTDKMIAKNQFKKRCARVPPPRASIARRTARPRRLESRERTKKKTLTDARVPFRNETRFEALKARAEATLDARREKLASMLFEEERALQAELVANQVTPEERKEALVARARALVAKREAERAQFAEQQLYRQWRAGCDGVRQGDSHAVLVKALAGRSEQVERKAAEKEAELREKDAFDALYEEERLKKEARHARDVEERKRRDEEAVRLLNEQVHENLGRRAEAADAKRRDVDELKQKWAAEEEKAAAEAAARAEKARLIAEELEVFNAQRRAEQAREKAEEEDFKKKLLDDAMAQIAAEEAREAELKERKKEQDRLYREHLSALMVKGQLDESERDRLIEAQQAKYEAKRQEEKDREERARANLMAEVYADRERQLAAKAARRAAAAEDKVEERRRMEEEMAEMRVAEEDHGARVNAVRVQNRLDIEAQIQYRDSMAAKMKEEQRRQWESSMRAEADYQRMIENDQRRANPATPSYARRSTAWFD
jgi:hypothetical protein